MSKLFRPDPTSVVTKIAIVASILLGLVQIRSCSTSSECHCAHETAR